MSGSVVSTCSEASMALNHYIYDYLCKSKLGRTASAFLQDTKLSLQEVEPLLNSEDSLLLEWFELFYSISGTLGKSSFQSSRIRKYIASLANLGSEPETPESAKEKHQPQVGSLRLPPMLCQRLKRRNSLDKKSPICESKGSKVSKSPPNPQADDATQIILTKLAKTNPKPSRLSPPRAISRMAAPTSIALPPNPLSNISWSKEEASGESNSGVFMADSLGHSAAISTDGFTTGVTQAGGRPKPTLTTQAGLRIPAPNQLNSSQRFVAQQHALQRHQLKKNSLNRQSSGTQLKPSNGPRPLLPNSNSRGESGGVLSIGPPVQFSNLEPQFPPQNAMAAAAFPNYIPQQPAVNAMPYASEGDEMQSFIEKYMNGSMFLNDYDAIPESGPYGTFTDDQMAIMANHMPLDRLP